MRILIVSNTRLTRETGAGRAQLETAEELARLGHSVETFDYVDAFRTLRAGRRDRLLPLRFARRAREHFRRNPGRWDVVEALQGALPFSKEELGFDGVLVARSTGLYAFYARYAEYERTRWPERLPGTPLGKALHRRSLRLAFAASERSVQTCDLVRVLNRAEERFVHEQLGLGHKCLTLPEGLSDAHAEALAASAAGPRDRLRSREVVAIGSWSLRKGAADWGEIVASVLATVPDARFLFLGTGVGEERVLHDLGLPRSERVSVVPFYRSDELPGLLRNATVGALPSYVEGWGLAVLEQLAAAVPSVAYDSPGPREMLGSFDSLLVPPGDVRAFSAGVAELLTLDEDAYSRLAAESVAVARSYLLPEIARRAADAYAAALKRLRR